jgi:hypothetical protein
MTALETLDDAAQLRQHLVEAAAPFVRHRPPDIAPS